MQPDADPLQQIERDRRPPLKSVKLLLPVWGHRYVRQFLEIGLPTLLAPRNVPALAQSLPSEFAILTSAADESYIRQHPAFLRLADICPASLRPIDHLITAGNNSTTLTLAYAEAIRAAGPAMLDTCFMFLVSDYIVADGSLASVLARVRAGASAVLVGNFQVTAEEATPWLRARIGPHPAAGAAFSARALMRFALDHLHPATVANTVNVSSTHNAHTNRLFWRVDEQTLLGRFFLMHMIAVRPEVIDFRVGASWDYSFVPEMCPSGNVSVITDSDEYLVVEMQPRTHEAGFLRPGPLQPDVLARSLEEWTTAQHRQNVAHTVVYHAGELPAALPAAVAAADDYVVQVTRRLRSPPQPHYGHPYWRGAIATVQEAARGQLSPEALRALLGAASRRGRWIERLRALLIGYPPGVRPWHPRWPDYGPVLRRLSPFFANPARRLLHVADAPTLFSVMLAAYGQRVTTLQTTPFLQGAPVRDGFVDHFGLCLIELDQRDVEKTGELIRRIAPAMQGGGTVLIVVREPRPMENAESFATALAETLRGAARLQEIRYVPASRLRAWSYQTFARLGADAHQRPWIGLPGLALFAVPLALLTLLANLFAAAGDGAGQPASSLHIDVRIANSE
ncbi:MAG: hypothetical protein JO084_07845 [Bradyrhizobiaceae bacterium]|nr:hypothetical protein [Bradyrhizobiaceae bacterium]